jgi:hypothetical protein
MELLLFSHFLDTVTLRIGAVTRWIAMRTFAAILD